MTIDQLKPNKIVRGPIFHEPVQVIVTVPMGNAVKLVARGVNPSRAYDLILTPDKLASLETWLDTDRSMATRFVPACSRGHASRTGV